MSNIVKAAGLDLALVKPYLKGIIFTMLLPVAIAVSNRSLAMGIPYAMAFISITESYAFTVSEKNGMERLYGILPVSKKQLVLGRYLYTFEMGFATLLISLLVQSAFLLGMSVSVSANDIFSAALAGAAVFTLLTVFQLPGYYAFGSVGGRFFVMIPYIFIFIFLYISNENPTAGKALNTLFDNPAILLIICAAAFVLSVCISVKIMQNKEN